MPQDAFTLRLSARELNDALRGGKINKINQPLPEEISFLIYTGKRTVKLVLNVNASDCGVYFYEAEQENPLVAPNFCMLLRKHLQNAEILEISTVGFERIVALRLKCVSDFSVAERILYAEIMGKYSNLILTENGVILGALKTTSLDDNCKRTIFGGVKYVLPAPQDKINPADLTALSALFAQPREGLARFLFLNVAGLAPCTAEQIVASYRGGDFAKHVHDYIFSDETSPCVLEQGGTPTDFYARSVQGGLPFSSLSRAQLYFYSHRRAKKSKDALAQKLSSAINAAKKKQEKRLLQISERKRDCADAEENRIKGELLTANLYALRKGMRECELYNYYSETGETLKISLDETLSPAQNAQNYFKRYRKQKRTLESLLPQEEEANAELDYLESLSAAVGYAADETDLKSVEEECFAAKLLRQPTTNRKKKQEIPFRLFEKDGFRIEAGRNNLQNDRLVKSAQPYDIWLHAQKFRSCHVLVRTERKAVPNEVLLFAAEICAAFSNGKGGKFPVDYCEAKYVKKPPRARAGTVTYSNQKTILVDITTKEK